MDLFLSGISHKTAPVEVREKLAVVSDDVKFLHSALNLEGVDEVVIISTCNRTEIYGISKRPEKALKAVSEWMAKRAGADISQYLYRERGFAAFTHLLKVASSLDSLVLGEAQILGQVKAAYTKSRISGAAGARMEKIFSRVFNVAKRVRTETKLGENSVSVAYVAVETAERIFGEIRGKTVMLVGAGKMCELAARHLRESGTARFLVVNRSRKKAEQLADEFGGTAFGLAELYRVIPEADIILCSTSSPHFLITGKKMSNLPSLSHKPRFFIDLSMPRDVEPLVGKLQNCFICDLDDLEKVADENREQRAVEAMKASAIVEEEVASMIDKCQAQAVLPVITALRRHASDMARVEVERTWSRLNAMGAPDETRENLDIMAKSIVNKILHEPTKTLKSAASSGEGYELAAAAADLFGLESLIPPLHEDEDKDEE